MRIRLVLGGVATALALASAAPAGASGLRPACAEGFEVVCTVIGLTCVLEPGEPCHP